MEFRTVVDIPRAPFAIEPCQQMLVVGSCFADSIGRRAREEKFRATVNPYGVMYNPASVLHTLERLHQERAESIRSKVAVITLGTNHVYREKATGEIVDNCQKRPQSLFSEEILTADECEDYLRRCVRLLQSERPDVDIIITVSPIRYRKYGYHESQLSKATLLMAVDRLIKAENDRLITSAKEGTPLPEGPSGMLSYFPAYEIVLDELRDYRFYQPDMLHPSEQAVEYIWQRFGETFFSERTLTFLKEWKPIREALAHRPFNADSEDYQAFLAATHEKARLLVQRYEGLEL